MLNAIRGWFGPKEPTALELYRDDVEAALADAVLSNDEWERLAARRLELGLTDDDARPTYIAVAMREVERRVLAALDDGQISPDEEVDLDSLGRSLRIDLSFVPDTQAQIDRAKRTWALANHPLPVVPSPLGLQRGEVAHMWVTAEAFEERSRTKAISYAGPTISIPIMTGVRYRMGRMNVGRETYAYQHSFGVGTLVVTNKRLLFVGDRSITTRLTNILDLDGFTDGVQVVRTTGKPHLYVYGEDDRDFGLVLARAWVNARS